MSAPKRQFIIPALLVFLFLIPCVSAAAGRKQAQATRPPEDKLTKELLREMLSDGPREAPQPGAAVAARSLPEANEERPAGGTLGEVGSAVASVPTWPVIGMAILLAGILWWLKRGGGRSARTGTIMKLASVSLGGKRSLALVQVLGHKLVLGLSDKNVSLLTRIDPEKSDPVAEPHILDDDLRGLVGGSEPSSMSGPIPPDAGEQADLVRKFRSFGSV